jgi:quercetin dioxygenase-like cupin family protein
VRGEITMERIVVRESEREFVSVDWGRRKILIDPEGVGSKYLRGSITEYAPGTEHAIHRHSNQEEVIFILEGEGISRTKDGDKPISAGAFVFIPGNMDHTTINVLKDRPMKAIIIKFPPEEGKWK